jgi:DNA-binding CsgD family transcriptional regulator
MAAAELQRVAGTHAGAALTATEQRVAQLVASGHTNREVAAELFTSVRTVEGHLAAVYRKLGLRGRVALAHHLNSTLTSSTPARTST